MKCSHEMLERWRKYIGLLLSEHGKRYEDVTSAALAWTIASKLDITREAYHVGLNDSHIKTALRKNISKLREDIKHANYTRRNTYQDNRSKLHFCP